MDTGITDYSLRIRQKFTELFQQDPLLVRAPGRVNLIGEHTDYNMGFVLPASINKAIYMGIHKRDDDEIHLHSLDYDDDFQINVNAIKRSGKLWPDYILGVVEQIRKTRPDIRGFNLIFGGDIPLGGGLSSSAALECATAYGLNEVFNLRFEKMELVRMSQAAENQFVGVKCGIMDQFASIFGRKGHLIRLDCETLEHVYIPFHAVGIKIILFDTRVKHSLASSAYNERRSQCQEGVRLIQDTEPQVYSLRYATEEMLLKYVKPVDEIVYNRCSYVVAENGRLLMGCKDLEKDDLPSFGKRMFETHAGLRDLYEVSCEELDILVDLVKDDPDVIGARMMGGGFGGCTINLVKAEGVDRLIEKVSEGYKIKTGRELLVYEVDIENGTGLIK